MLTYTLLPLYTSRTNREGLLPAAPPGSSKKTLKHLNRLKKSRWDDINNDEYILNKMIHAKVLPSAYDALEQTEHWQHASSRYKEGSSLEQSHNQVHVALGHPMSSIAFAAFYPAFFFHHCNIDRIYEAYLDLEGAEECKREFKASQRGNARKGDRNRFKEPLEPFEHPTGKPFMPEDTFDTESIGYVYDVLPEERPQQMRAAPTFVLFRDLQPMSFADQSTTLHVFLVPKAEAAAFTVPDEYMAMCKHPNYAGQSCIFGGRGDGCENCLDRGAWNQAIDVSATLKKLELSRYEVEIVVHLEMEDGGPPSDEERAAVPVPVITGPFFADTELKQSHDDPSTTENPNGDAAQLQQRLKELGFYDGAVDGWFGPTTAAAVSAYQRAHKLTADGIAGPATKVHLVMPLNDGVSHLHPDGDHHEPLVPLPPSDGSQATYFVGVSPGYMDRDAFLAEVATAFATWAAVTPALQFARTEDEAKATLILNFTDADERESGFTKKFQQSDGVGGKLAEASSTGVSFDRAERWLLQGQESRAKTTCFEFLPVCIHELGHVYGMAHTMDEADVMYPYYKPGAVTLSEADAGAVKVIFSDVSAAESRAASAASSTVAEARAASAASSVSGRSKSAKKVEMKPVAARRSSSWRAAPPPHTPSEHAPEDLTPPAPKIVEMKPAPAARRQSSWRTNADSDVPPVVEATPKKDAQEKSSFCTLL